MGYTMPQVYGKYDFLRTGKDWDFSRYIPDAVTICLGQNDGVQDSTAFCSAYVSFIGQIRSHYPDAFIVCMNSPMGDDYLTNALENYLTGVVNYMNNQGDSKVTKCIVSHNLNDGCTSHPDLSQHELIADELTEFLQNNITW